MFKPTTDYCALSSNAEALSPVSTLEHEDYYRARVKHISGFKPLPNTEGFSTYKDILDRIVELYNYSGDFSAYVSSSDVLVELVLKTPSLLDKSFSSENGPADIIGFLSRYPSCHKYIIHDAAIVKQFIETKKRWAKSFIALICTNADVCNSFLSSELMMCAVSLEMSELPDDYNYLCAMMRRTFQVEEKYIHPVEHLKAPRFELQECFEERSDAIYNLLKSLKPISDEESHSNGADDPSASLTEVMHHEVPVSESQEKSSLLLMAAEESEKENFRKFF